MCLIKMTAENGKRITFKRTRPNPLFQDWLEELYEEAKQKNRKVEIKLKEALDSISKYPLPLETGSECAILKGFDKRLCLYLDKRLELYTSSEIKTFSNVNVNSSSASDNGSSTLSSNVPQLKEQPTEILSNASSNNHVDRVKYKPAFRSGGYAILMALLDQTRHKNKALKKTELIDLAQKYCEESFTTNKPGTYYSAWSNMGRLVKKGLVNKVNGGKQTQYTLTELGISVATDLLIDTQKRPSMNDIIFSDPSLNPKPSNQDPVGVKKSQNSNEVESKIDKCFSTNNMEQNVVVNDIELCSSPNNYDKNILNTENIKDYPKLLCYDQDLIIMEPQSFDIILLIDKNETSGASRKNDPTVAQFNKYPDLKHDYRSLKVGDFTWVARHKISNQELVLPYVVERKRMDDLGASIKDGRFHEQKFRLRKCGLKNVIYMVEHYGSNKHVGLPVPTLMQALANTRVQDGFKVHVTDSLTHSARFLAIMTLRLTFEFQNKRLKGCDKEAKEDILMTFEYFNKSSVKNKPLSVTDTFIKLLLQLKGVSVQKALAITSVYKTPASLIKQYRNCSQREGEMLLANLKCDDFSPSVGPSVSKTIYQLFTFENFT